MRAASRRRLNDIGYAAADALLQQIETGAPLQGNCLMEGELVVRESAAPPQSRKA